MRILVTGAAGFNCGYLATAESAHEGALDARSASASHAGGNPSASLMRVADISTDVNMSAGGHTRTSPAPGRMRGPSDVCVTSNVGGARATAKLIASQPDAHVFTLGDNSNETGTAAQYADCYGSTWGQFLDRTSAAVGNHDY